MSIIMLVLEFSHLLGNLELISRVHFLNQGFDVKLFLPYENIPDDSLADVLLATNININLLFY